MSVGNNLFQGIVWSAIERISIQAVQFGLGIVLARLLTPTEYGTIGLLLVFITLSQVFIDSGFTKALIQKKDRSENDKSTVFLFNIGISIFFYVLLWFSAPLISSFYSIPELTLLLRVLALSLIINASFSVSATMITIAMNFRLFAKINLMATIISGGIAIFLAYTGSGVWALVYQTIIKSTLTATFIWFSLKWFPNLVFSKSSFKNLFSYGSKLLISNLLGAFSSQINSLLIGKYIGAKELGLYSRGIQFSDVVFGIFNASIANVLLPGLAPLQDQKDILISHTRTIIKTSAIIVIPIFMFLAVFAEPIIRILLTEKWIGAAPIMQFFCIARMITIIVGININLLYVIGKTDLVLKQQYYCIAIRISLLLMALPFGIYYIAAAELISTSIHFFINTYYPGKIMRYGAYKQIKDILPILFSGTIMAIVLIILNTQIKDDVVSLLAAIFIAPMIYIILIRIFKVQEFNTLLNKIKIFSKNK